jgi:hypothetical protein
MYFGIYFVRQINKTKEGEVLFRVGFSVSFVLFPPKTQIMGSNFAVAVGSEVITVEVTLVMEPDEVGIFSFVLSLL